MSTTPNMGLVIPEVGETVDPTWAAQIVAAFEDVDVHDHTSNFGVRIPTAGLNINADLSFAGFNATNIRTTGYEDQASDPATASDFRVLYSKNGDLYFKNSAGSAVQITTGASIAGATGSITGLSAPASAAFSSNMFSWQYDTAKYAKMSSGWLEIYPYDGSTVYSFFNRIKANTALAASLDVTLFTALPSTVVPVTISNTGQLAVAADGSVSVPTYNFTGETNSGWYRFGAGILGLSVGGTNKLFVTASNFQSSVPVLGSNGSASAPAFGFLNNSDLGLYRSAANTLGVATAGVERVTLNTTALVSTLPFRGSAGSAGAPMYSFSAETNSGLFQESAAVLGVSVGGSNRLSITSVNVVPLVPVLGVDGLASAPSLTFRLDSDTGFYRVGENTLGIATGGAQRLTFSNTEVVTTVPMRGGAGSAASPTYTFTDETNSGVFRESATVLGISIGGTNRLSITSVNVVPLVPVLGVNGSVSAPSFSFLSDSTSGIYRVGAGVIGVSTSGVNRITLSSSSLETSVPHTNVDGSETAPSYTFASDPTMGVYRAGANLIGFGTQSTVRFQIGVGASTFRNLLWHADGAATDPSIAFENDTNTGLYSAAADTIGVAVGGASIGTWSASALDLKTPISMSGAGGSAVAHKTTIVTGTLASGASQTVFSGATVYNATGWAEVTGGWAPITLPSGGTDVRWNALSSSDTAVQIVNNAAFSRQFRVIVTHA